MINYKQKGFSVIYVLFFIVLIATVGFVGWRVYDIKNSTDSSSASVDNNPSVAGAKSSLETIKSADDIDKSTKELDSANLDKDLDSTSIDQDLNSML